MITIQQMLAELREFGVSDSEIARKTGIPQPTITRVRNAVHGDTSYTNGKRIEKLCKSVKRKMSR